MAYVSLPTYKGFLNTRGINTTMRDFNIEGLHITSLCLKTAEYLNQAALGRFCGPSPQYSGVSG
jgi:hypothetical protein